MNYTVKELKSIIDKAMEQGKGDLDVVVFSVNNGCWDTVHCVNNETIYNEDTDNDEEKFILFSEL